jgi:hypothetical protein
VAHFLAILETIRMAGSVEAERPFTAEAAVVATVVAAEAA